VKDKVLKKICKGQPCEHGVGYCILKELVMRTPGLSERLLIQSDCVNRFKYEEGLRTDKDVGWSGALELWVERGYAKAFADLYDEDADPAELYAKIIKAVK